MTPVMAFVPPGPEVTHTVTFGCDRAGLLVVVICTLKPRAVTQSIIKVHRAAARYREDVCHALICKKIRYYLRYFLHIHSSSKSTVISIG